jgi:hypothetical protein
MLARVAGGETLETSVPNSRRVMRLSPRERIELGYVKQLPKDIQPNSVRCPGLQHSLVLLVSRVGSEEHAASIFRAEITTVMMLPYGMECILHIQGKEKGVEDLLVSVFPSTAGSYVKCTRCHETEDTFSSSIDMRN